MDLGTWVTISRELRTPNGCYAFLENVRGPIEVGDVVHVKVKGDELRNGELIGGALVTAIEDEIVYLSVAWHTLHDAYRWTGRVVP